jgi:hypothetical protein
MAVSLKRYLGGAGRVTPEACLDSATIPAVRGGITMEAAPGGLTLKKRSLARRRRNRVDLSVQSFVQKSWRAGRRHGRGCQQSRLR